MKFPDSVELSGTDLIGQILLARVAERVRHVELHAGIGREPGRNVNAWR
jgi:hypothetical protein